MLKWPAEWVYRPPKQSVPIKYGADAEEQFAIAEAKSLREAGMGLRRIATTLAARGFFSRAGSVFDPTQIRRMLGEGSKTSKASRASWQARRRAARRGVRHEQVDVFKIFERDGWRCKACGRSTPKEKRGSRGADAPEINYIVPLVEGGPHTYKNIRCVCRACNVKRSVLVGSLAVA